MGYSLRKTGTERVTGRVAQGSLLLVSPQQGVSGRVLRAHGHTLGKLLLVWFSSHIDLGRREMSLHVEARSVKC
jgi:hypothetical protein